MSGSTDAAASGETTQNVVFPISFPNAVLQVMVSTLIASPSALIDVFYQTYSPTYTGVSVQRASRGGDDVATTPIIFAIGY
jgi:hypothetical protein